MAPFRLPLQTIESQCFKAGLSCQVLAIITFNGQVKYSRGYNKNSKTVAWLSPMHKEGNELCIIYSLIHGSVL